MPLPFLIPVAIAAIMSGGLGAVAKSVNRDYELELNRINDEMRKMAAEAEAAYRSRAKRTEQAMAAWGKARQSIVNEAVMPFARAYSKLKGVSVEGQVTPGALARVEQLTLNLSTNSRHDLSALSEAGAAWSGAVMGVALGGAFFASSLLKGVKLQEQIDEAKAARARLKVEIKALEAKGAKLELIRRRAQEMQEVAGILGRLLAGAATELDSLFATAGGNWRRYTPEQKEQVLLAVQLCDTLQAVLRAPLMTPEHELDRRAEGIMVQAKQLVAAVR